MYFSGRPYGKGRNLGIRVGWAGQFPNDNTGRLAVVVALFLIYECDTYQRETVSGNARKFVVGATIPIFRRLDRLNNFSKSLAFRHSWTHSLHLASVHHDSCLVSTPPLNMVSN